MRRFALLLALMAALVFGASEAKAWTASGATGWGAFQTCDPGNIYPLYNVHVAIHNDSTGKNGSTNSNGSGFFSFSGMVAGQSYTVTPSASGWQACFSVSWTQSAQNKSGLILTLK